MRVRLNAERRAQKLRSKIGPIQPDQSMLLWVNRELAKQLDISQRFKDGNLTIDATTRFRQCLKIAIDRLEVGRTMISVIHRDHYSKEAA